MFELTDEQSAIRRLARDFAEGEVRPVAEELDREKRFPYGPIATAAELGLMGIPYSEEYGGGGADNVSYALAIEELARVDSSVAITERRPEGGAPPRALLRAQALVVRSHRAGGGVRRRQHPNDRDARGRPLANRRREAVHHQRGHRHLGRRDHHGAHRTR